MPTLHDHPEYLTRAMNYKYYRDHFDGGRDYPCKDAAYLPQWTMESDEAYQKRLARAVYINYCSTVISIYQAALFQKAPAREISVGSLLPLVVDIDRMGTTANDFFRGVTEQAQAVGLHFVLVDAPPRVAGKTYTVDDARAAGLSPYVVSVPAENVRAWGIESQDPARMGALNFVAIQETGWGGNSPFEEMVSAQSVRVYYPDRCELYSSGTGGLSLVSTTPNPLGVVPLVPFYGRRVATFEGESDLREIAPLAQKIANWLSWLDEDMMFHALRQLVVKTNSDIAKLGIGSSRAIKLSPDQKEDIFVLESAGNPSKELWDSIMRAQDLIYRLALNQITAVKDTAQVESADKKRLDSKELSSMLKAKAGAFERAESQVWGLLAAMSGADPSGVVIEYNREFVLTEQTVADWQAKIESGVLSVLDWILEENPGVTTTAEAEKVLDSNLKLRTKVRDLSGLGDVLTASGGAPNG